MNLYYIEFLILDGLLIQTSTVQLIDKINSNTKSIHNNNNNNKAFNPK
jgi:hypothetical protein